MKRVFLFCLVYLLNCGYCSKLDARKLLEHVNSIFPDLKQVCTKPMSWGTADFVAEDLCLTFDGVVVQINVVEARKIQVELTAYKIELGDTVVAKVSVIDNMGQYLDVDSHKKLNLAIVTNEKKLSFKEIAARGRKTTLYEVKGEQIGSTTFIVKGSLFNQDIESPPVSVDIFTPLKIVPSNLTLVVGAEFQVTCIGGSQPKSIEFLVSDGSIAKIEQSGLISSLRVGKTKLIARALNVNHVEYSRAEVYIHVIALKRIKIVSPGNNLLVGAQFPLRIVGSNSHETLFTFASASPPLKVKWQISGSHGKIMQTFENANIRNDLNAFSVNLMGLTPGLVTVKTTLQVTVPSKDSRTQQIVNNQILSDTIQIYIVPEFHLTSPTRYVIHGGSILMSPKSEFSLISNRDDETESEYSLINSTNIDMKLGRTPVLVSGLKGKAILTAKTKNFGLIQTTTFSVAVEPISYMLAQLENVPSKQDSIETIPLGSTLVLKITFHDKIGRVFDAFKTDIDYLLSRRDLVDITRLPNNSTLRVRAVKEGRVIINLFDNINDVSTYFAIDIGSVILPNESTATFADVIYFQNKLKGNGIWSVDNPKVVSINEETGVSLIHGIGKTTVRWNSPEGLQTYIQVRVDEPREFLLDSKNLHGVTNFQETFVPIKVLPQSKMNIESCKASSKAELDTNDIPFDCRISAQSQFSASDVWKTHVIFDKIKCSWFCVISPLSNEFLPDMTTIETNVVISASIVLRAHDFNSKLESLTTSLIVQFLPSFHIFTQEITITHDEHSVITVTGINSILSSLKVTSKDLEILQVKQVELNNKVARYQVYLVSIEAWMQRSSSSFYVEVSSELTGQSERVLVRVKLDNAIISTLQNSLWFQLLENISQIGISLVVTCIVVFVSYKLFTRKSVGVPVVASRSDISSPFIKDAHSPFTTSKRVFDYSNPTSTPTATSTVSSINTSPSSSPRIGRALYSTR